MLHLIYQITVLDGRESRVESLVEAPAFGAQLYERLREGLLAGEFAPGERLSVSALAARFGVSTMPVRDALRLLEQDGLVETAARRWTRVVQVDPSEIEQLLPLLSLLEQYALRSAKTLDAATIDELERINAEFAAAAERGDVGGIVAADVAFHEALVRLADNPSLERAMRDAKTRVRLIRTEALRTTLTSQSHADHAAIVAALRSGDRKRAVKLVDANWGRGLERYALRGQQAP